VTTVHRNLNLAAWTVKDTPSSPTRRVKAIALRGVTFVVQPGGRARVLARKVRAVHAYARGTAAEPRDPAGLTEVTYNPYRAATFTTRDGRPVTAAAYVVFHTDGKAYAEDIR
jgi:hypothetical protein